MISEDLIGKSIKITVPLKDENEMLLQDSKALVESVENNSITANAYYYKNNKRIDRRVSLINGFFEVVRA